MKKNKIVSTLMGTVFLLTAVVGCTPESPPLPPRTGDETEALATQAPDTKADVLSRDELASKAAQVGSAAQSALSNNPDALDAFARASKVAAEAESLQQASEDATSGFRLTVTSQTWSGWSTEQPEPDVTVFDNVTVGTVVHKGVTVLEIREDSIVLAFENTKYWIPDFRIPGSDPESPKTFTVYCGLRSKVQTTTTDVGSNLYFYLEKK